MATSTLGSGTLVLAGTTSGTTTVTATAVAGTTTLTLPAATDTLVGKATTDTLTNKTLTGAVMNGTLGATTPSTVAATTISASSTATFAAGAAGTPSITTTGDTNTGIFFPAADTIAFAEGGAESARFDSSGNFGLGVTPSAWTTSFGFKALDIGQGCVLGATSDANLVFNAYFNTSNNWIYKTTAEAGRYQQSGANHIWYTAPSGTAGNTATFSERMRLDTSGNLGLGVTPSGWPAGRPAIEIGGTTTGNLAFNGNNTNGYQIWNNSYYNGSVSIYKYNGYATNFGAGGNGSFFWSLAPSGTAGGTVTFTQAMTLDASGNLGIGTTSPAAKLNISGGDAYFFNTATYGGIRIGYDGSNYWSIQRENASTGRLGFFSGASEKVSIDPSGNLGIGTTSPSNRLSLKTTSGGCWLQTEDATNTSGGNVNLFGSLGTGPAAIYTTGAQPIAFYTNSTERARIDSSGNLLVAKTALSTTTVGVELRPGGRVVSTLASSTSGDSTYEVYSTGAGAYRFYVDMAGTIRATSITITAISDERLKENVRDIDTGLNSIMALKPRRFDWKEGKGQDKKNVAGFIAQEFETIFPECVSTSKAGADGIEYKNINHETLIPTLVKAIQEQQALITTLTARITALESA